MRFSHIFAAAVLLAAGAQPLFAQQHERRFTPEFGLSVSTMAIESAAATRSEIGDRSYGLQIDAGVLMKRHFYFGVDLGGQFLDDHAQFTQSTTGGEMKSTASVTYLSALTGVRTGVLNAVPLALALNVGASATMSRRSIDNCSDCDVDKLDVPGGAFVEPVLVLGRRTVRFRMSNRVYLGGEGMLNVVSVGADRKSVV